MDPRKLIKAEMAKRGLEKTKRMAAPIINKVKKTEAFVHHQLETPLWHYGLRILFVLHVILTKKLPDAWVMLSKNIVFRVLCALVIVYLAYIDIFSAALLAVAVVLLIQESNARVASAMLITGQEPNTVSDKEKLHLSVGMGQKNIGADDSAIGLSSYGSPDEVIDLNAPSEYVSQIGTLGITQDMAGDKLPLVVDAEEQGTKFYKVNMGQSINSVIYDQPASKTLTENIEEAQTGYITAKNLLDAQINGAQGADTEVPCAVESIAGSFNAQGLGIPMAFANDSCMYSKVN